MNDTFYGRCRCGASLTIDHLQHHCPLRPQQDELGEASLRAVVEAVFAARYTTSHVAVLGEN